MAVENGGQGNGTPAGGAPAPTGGTPAPAPAAAPSGTPVVNQDGTVTIGDQTFIPKASYDVVAEKQRENTEKLKAIEKEKSEAEAKRLAENGEFKTLAEKAQAELDLTKQNFAKREKVNALKLAAVQAGTVDADAVEALAKLDQITISEDGVVDQSTVKTAIDTLKKEKPYLFGTGGTPAPTTPPMGNSGGAPQGAAGGEQTFKRSQLQDADFYRANRDAILAAAKAGRIIDDLTPGK